MYIHEERIQFSRALHLSVNGEDSIHGVYTHLNGVAAALVSTGKRKQRRALDSRFVC